VLPPLPRQRTNPVVYLHIRRESDRSIAVQLASHLVERGYQVAALEHIADRGPRESQLRYFLADGEEEAIGLQGILAGMGTEVTLVYLPGYEGRGADRPHFEIWLAPALDAG
jgi:hypothetical protein